MSDVSVWRLFAYMNDDEDGRQDETQRISEWQIEDKLRWCVTRGYDHIYLYRDRGDTTRFEHAAPVPVRHHMHLVTEGSTREPAGDAA